MRQRVALCDQKDPSDLGFSAPNAVMRLPLFLRDRTSPARSAMSGKCHEETFLDYSITSSAVASSEGGMVRPSAFAVLRLTISSNLVGCSTGRSPGLAPFRI